MTQLVSNLRTFFVGIDTERELFKEVCRDAAAVFPEREQVMPDTYRVAEPRLLCSQWAQKVEVATWLALTGSDYSFGIISVFFREDFLACMEIRP